MATQSVVAPHDSTFKGFMSKVDNARDFFEVHLPNRIKHLCNFDTLKLASAYLWIKHCALVSRTCSIPFKHSRVRGIFISWLSTNLPPIS